MFCKNCGKKLEEDAKFCKDCGITVGGTAAAVLKEAPKESTQTFPKSSEPPVAVQIIKACIQILILGLFLYWIWYSYGCATGKYLNTGDQACKWFYQVFNTEDNNNNNNRNNNNSGCISTGCGSQWYCSGTYYTEGVQKRVNGCVTTRPGEIYSSWSGTCRKCP